MSKLSKQLQLLATNNKKLIHDAPNYMTVNQSMNTDPVQIRKEYRLTCTFEKSVWLDDNITLQSYAADDYVQRYITSAKRAIIEEVYGEYRPFLIELRSALYDHDIQRAHNLIAQMELSMFHEV